MSIYFFAFVEVYNGQLWHLGDPLEIDPDHPDKPLVPKNIAPPWGWDQIMFYDELSGERGLPADLSNGLRRYLETHWHHDAYGASWMTLKEIKSHLAAETSQQFFHFNPAWFEHHPFDDSQIRVVFWHD